MEQLQTYAADVHSQFGEDGIIAEILDRIAVTIEPTKWCVEFGAADGVWLSNTCNLIRQRDYRAVLIEVDPDRAAQLAVNHPQPEVIKLSRRVGFDGDDRLESILAGSGLPIDFDVLSIDIDGCDYWVLDSIETYQPRVIIIEFNPSIPNCVEFVQPRDFSVQQGSSPLSLQKLAASKGYELVATTFVNLILVRSDLCEAVLGLGNEPASLDDLRDDSECITHVFAGYDGTLLFSRPSVTLPWHHTAVDPMRLQPLPRFWRSYPGDWPIRGLRTQSWRIFRRLRSGISWSRNSSI
ncbi:MAG: hypothetical protein F2520_02170 [Actinobacteria bacterium]|uniref:Unannotated protein n=1 Tax=freshwater metagenome TaxID=449393 RepID=A0A6J5YG06_9ZZZZ|nr:hypothetical protein [Actinomycetota bacterium]